MTRPYTRRRQRGRGAEATLERPDVVNASVVDVHHQYLRDDLTDLGGHLALREHLQDTIDQYQPFGLRPALLLIDVDAFGAINRTYGRSIADEVLLVTATRLRQLVPGEHATYRTVSDEFVALLESSPMIDAVAEAGMIQRALSQSVQLPEAIVQVKVSVAVVMLGHRHRVDALLRDADTTMYRAKTEGGNRVDIYNWELDSWSTARKRDVERLQQEVDRLRRANRTLVEALTIDLATGMANDMAFESDHVQLEAWRKRTGETYSILRVRIQMSGEVAGLGQELDDTDPMTQVAHAVRDTIRESDRAYVLGVGDFGVLLRGSTLKQALAAADRIRVAVGKIGLARPEDSGQHLDVTIAAIEAGFRHAHRNDVLKEVNDLLHQASGTAGGPRIVWPH